MGNTFGSLTKQFPLVDLQSILQDRERFYRDPVKELSRANSYYSMSGRWPDVGWLLLDRRSYSQLDQYASDLRLVISDYVNDDVVIDDLSVIQARCVTRGIEADPDAIYLVQVTNSQGVLYNPWFQFPTNSQYNVRVPAYDTKFYDWSMDVGTTWTWDTMVRDLWEQAPLQLGDYPGLPTTPLGTPENWIFVGVPLWEAISRVLDYLGMSVSGFYPDLDIVVTGDPDPVFSDLQQTYSGNLEDDMEYMDGGSGRAPGRVVVYAHRRNQVYGTEETGRYDSRNWQSTPLYSTTVLAPSQFAGAQGTAYLWVDQTVRFDQEGNPVLADVLAFNAIAQERASQFFNKIFRGTQGFMRQVYAGALPFSTGSLVDGVRWSNHGYTDRYCGWRTEVIRGYTWEEATFPLTVMGLTGPV